MNSILSFVGYWATIFAGIVLSEHVFFRKCDFSQYDVSQWNTASKLPVGIAGIMAFCIGMALIVLSMEQSYFTGPIAHHTGDIALLMGFCSSFLVYAAVRTAELSVLKR
jgi:purine-cytosine permease-like protein